MWSDSIDFVGRDAVTLEDLAKWCDHYHAQYGKNPKLIVINEERMDTFFPDWRNSDLKIKVNNKVKKTFLYRGIPMVQEL